MKTPMRSRWLMILSLTAMTLGPLTEQVVAAKVPFIGKKNAEVFVPSGQWEPYLRDEKGQLHPLLQPIERNSDRDWMYLQFTDYLGPRRRLAVMKVQNRTAQVEQAEESGGIVFGEITAANVAAIEEMLTASMLNTNRFSMVERKRVQTLLAEQDFGASGRVNGKTAAKIGKVLGTDYLLLSAINEWTPERKKLGTGGLGIGMLPNIGLGKTTAEVAITFELADATTGEIVFSEIVRATAGSWGISGTGGIAGAASNGAFASSSPISYAIQACLNKASYMIATSLKSQTWKAMVAKVEGEKVTLNAGSTRGVTMGMKLTALAKGQPILDPETGDVLGEDTEAIGSLAVTAVKDNLSIATVVQGCERLKVGDYVELAAENP